MNLAVETWYVRWFFWSVQILHAFRGRDWWENEQRRIRERGTNLCAFVQTTILWAPVVLALHLALYGGGIAALTAVPIYFFGFWGYAWGAGAIIAIVCVVVALALLLDWESERRKKHPELVYEQQKKAEPTEKKPADPSFFAIFWAWLTAKKQKVCPLITFTKSEKEQS